MEIAKQKELVDNAQTWFDGKLKTVITDNRRRYRMQLQDEKTRRDLGLSAIPSTKSTAAVDRYVERLAIEMFQDPDSISFTSKSALDPTKDIGGQILTQDFIYRSKAKNGMFPFFTWHQASSLAGAVDGLEACMLMWRHESYTTPQTTYQTASGQPISKEQFDLYSQAMPDAFQAVETSKKTTVVDTWWIDQLEPGKDIVWDPSIGLLDVELGQFCYVRLRKTPDQIRAMAATGLIDPARVTDELLKKHQKPGTQAINYTLRGDKTIDDGKDVDLKERNSVELGVFFHKENCRWFVCFSLGLTDSLSDPKPVNEVWFRGRNVNILPVSVGYNKPKLWEQVGWAIPELIKPLEDEHTNHKNNISDAAKIAIQGRWWVDSAGDTNINNLLNSRVVYGKKDVDFGPMDTNLDVVTSIRADDMLNQEVNELIPAGMQSGARGVVPKGTNKTLGATQLGKMESDEKLGVQIVTRNETFFYKVLYLIAQLTIAYENNETVLRIAGRNAGVALPEIVTFDGRRILDLSVLDIDVDIQINAGLGSAPRYQKAQSTMQLVDWGKLHEIRVDAVAAYRQLSVLAGYGPEDLLDKSEPPPPPPPEVDYKLNLSLTLSELLTVAPEAGPAIAQKLLSGQMSVSTTVDEPDPAAKMREARQNGGGMMISDRTGTVVDGTNGAAMGMSMGGQA